MDAGTKEAARAFAAATFHLLVIIGLAVFAGNEYGWKAGVLAFFLFGYIFDIRERMRDRGILDRRRRSGTTHG